MSDGKQRFQMGAIGATFGVSGNAAGSTGNRTNSEFLPQAAKMLEKNNHSGKPTIRLNIELFQTDSENYPEFNYVRLMRLEKVFL